MLINLSTLPYKETFSIPPRPRNVSNPRTNECLYLNARSLNNKTSELQTLVTDVYLIAITETWLKPETGNCKFLPGNDFTIHRKDRVDRIGGGTLLAVRNSLFCFRREDLESNAEMLVCEICPKSKKKFLVIVFYRPPDTDLNYLKEFASWDQCYVPDNIDKSLSNWCDFFLSAADNHHPWFDKEL